MVQNCRNKDEAWTFAVHDQLHEISSLESMTSRGKDVIRSIETQKVEVYYEQI
jgi:hypothetical protein